MRIFDGSDACVTPVLALADAPSHPHLAERHTYVEHEGVTQPAPAPRFSRTPAALGRPPSATGADTRAALLAWGVTGVDDLIASGVATQA